MANESFIPNNRPSQEKDPSPPGFSPVPQPQGNHSTRVTVLRSQVLGEGVPVILVLLESHQQKGSSLLGEGVIETVMDPAIVVWMRQCFHKVIKIEFDGFP